jgi:hypothetical protein
MAYADKRDGKGEALMEHIDLFWLVLIGFTLGGTQGKRIRCWMAVVAACGLMTWTTAASAVDHTIRHSAYGCKSKDYHSRLTGYLVDGDKEAFKRALSLAAASGECKFFEEGQQVYLEDTAIFSGLVCVRPQGNLDCFWTDTGSVR